MRLQSTLPSPQTSNALYTCSIYILRERINGQRSGTHDSPLIESRFPRGGCQLKIRGRSGWYVVGLASTLKKFFAAFPCTRHDCPVD